MAHLMELLKLSLSARRAWIEITPQTPLTRFSRVALRKESVDRNHAMQVVIVIVEVALRKESVDRNLYLSSFALASLVALRKESVDRNSEDWLNAGSLSRSLSARRAWIEILIFTRQVCLTCVALRKESVDRNIPRGQLPATQPPSLSARRAWIEIQVAHQRVCHSGCRSPQGERG